MSAQQSIVSIKSIIAALALVLLAIVCVTDAKFLRRSRYYDDGLYGNGGMMGGPTGERALITVRGAHNPYDGRAPQKLTIEDQPYRRGPYPRGVYDRLDGYGSSPLGMGLGMGMGGYAGRYPGGYGHGGYGAGPMFGAPARIAVTGAFPYGYGSRF